MSDLEEMWRDIEGYEENYEISNTGKIKNKKNLKILSQTLRKDGYYIVNLSKNKKQNCFLVHRLLGIAFIENPLNLPCIDHINNQRNDNRISNLRWATNQENQRNKVLQKNNISGAKGVSFHKKSNKWHVLIMINKKQIYLGLYDDLEEAKAARQKKANEIFGSFTNSCERQN